MNFDEYVEKRFEGNELLDVLPTMYAHELSDLLKLTYEAGQAHPVGFEKMKAEIEEKEYQRGYVSGVDSCRNDEPDKRQTDAIDKARAEGYAGGLAKKMNSPTKITISTKEFLKLYDDFLKEDVTIDLAGLKKDTE